VGPYRDAFFERYGDWFYLGVMVVSILGSAATREAALEAGFDVIGYRRASDPNLELAFEEQAAEAEEVEEPPTPEPPPEGEDET
jgi:hypothetical protein